MHSWSSIQGKANQLGIKKRTFWSEDEKNLLISVYSIMDINEVVKMFPNRNKESLINMARKLNITSFNHNVWRKEDEDYIIQHWELMSDELIARNIGKTRNAVKRKRNLLGLHRKDKSQPTYENISKYIRGNIWYWKNESMKQCNYQCVLTGSKDFEIHHIYPVNKMINNVFTQNNIPYKNFNDYTQDELKNILSLFILEQDKYPLGECVRKDIHVLFHSLYGQYNTTQSQWEQFKKDFKNGEYDNHIKRDIVA